MTHKVIHPFSFPALLAITLAVLFLFLPELVWPSTDDKISAPTISSSLHQCHVDLNGSPVPCMPPPPLPIIMYEYNDPALTGICGPPTYPFQVDGIWIELCNPNPVPVNVIAVPQVYNLGVIEPSFCPQPGALLCSGPETAIPIPPLTHCMQFYIPLGDICCVTGPYFAGVNLLGSDESFNLCTDEFCDTCKSYYSDLVNPPVDICKTGLMPGNWRLGSDGRTFGQNQCPRDHFKAWRINPLPIEVMVTVEDQFMKDDLSLYLIDFLSNPAVKDTFGIPKPDDHLTWYRAAGRDTFFKVEYVNQFESTTVLIDSAAYLLVPAQKLPHDPPLGLDHYKCYRVIDPKPIEREVLLQDQFDFAPERVAYLTSRYFCAPCMKNAEPRFDTLTHYLAYQFQPQPKTVEPRIALDQFGLHEMFFQWSEMLLVPTKKLSVPFPDTCWYYKKGYPDYAPFGVPDFDQKQDAWVNSIFQWNYCGPTAAANCLWWFDSKFDSLSPTPPPGVYDKYPLVKWMNTMPPVLDDHDTLNVIPLVDSLAKCMQTGEQGTDVFVMESCLVKWLKAVNLHDDYVESTFFRPEFDKVEKEIERSQNVILLLGFYDSNCNRMGGHYVTAAGVCSEKWQIAISDPYFDKHEGNPPGPPTHGSSAHNDAALISGPHGTNTHDIYQAAPLMPNDPCLACGAWELVDYPDSFIYVLNFEWQNDNPFCPNQGYLGGPLRTIVEFAVDISPESCIALPGDANSSNTITLGDAIAIVNYIFNKPGWPPCPSASNMCWLSDLLCRGDVNGDGLVTLGDVIYLVNYIFNKPGGPWYPIPNGKCCLKLPDWPLRH